jgi:hypothetical protein
MTGVTFPIRLGWVSTCLLVAAPAVFIGWIIWVTITIQMCSVPDIRMLGGPTVAFLLGCAGTTSAVVMLSRRATALAVALVTVGVLESVAFGLAIVQAGLCIGAPA